MPKRGRGARRGGGAKRGRGGASSSEKKACNKSLEEEEEAVEVDTAEIEGQSVTETNLSKDSDTKESTTLVSPSLQAGVDQVSPSSLSELGTTQVLEKDGDSDNGKTLSATIEVSEASRVPKSDLAMEDEISIIETDAEIIILDSVETKVSQVTSENVSACDSSVSEKADTSEIQEKSLQTCDITSAKNSSDIGGAESPINPAQTDECVSSVSDVSKLFSGDGAVSEVKNLQTKEQVQKVMAQDIMDTDCPTEQPSQDEGGEEKTTEDFVEAVEEMCEDVSKEDPEEAEEFIAEAFCVDKDDGDDEVQYIDEEIDDQPIEISQSISSGENEKPDVEEENAFSDTKGKDSESALIEIPATEEDDLSKFEEISDGSMEQAEQDEVLNDNDSLDLEITGESYAVEIIDADSKTVQGTSGKNEAESLEAVFFATENDTDEKVLVEDKDNDEISDASLSDHNLSLEEISDDDLDMSKKRRKSGVQTPVKTDGTDAVSEETKISASLESNQEGMEDKEASKKRPASNTEENPEAKKVKLGSEEKVIRLDETKASDENEPAFYTGVCGKTNRNESAGKEIAVKENAGKDVAQSHFSIQFRPTAAVAEKDKVPPKAPSTIVLKSKEMVHSSCQTDKKHLKGKIVQCNINPIKVTPDEGAKKATKGDSDSSSEVFNAYKAQIPSSITEQIFATVTSASAPDKDRSYTLSMGPVTMSDMDSEAFRDIALKGMNNFTLTFDGHSHGTLTTCLSQQSDVVKIMRKLKHLQIGNRYMLISVTYQCKQAGPQRWTGTLVLMYDQDSQQAKQSVAWDGKMRAQLNISGVPPGVSKDFVHVFFPEALSVSSAPSVDEHRTMALSFSSTVLVNEISSGYELVLINGSQIHLKERDDVEEVTAAEEDKGFEEEAGVVVIQDLDEATDATDATVVADAEQELPVVADAEKQIMENSSSEKKIEESIDKTPTVEGESSMLVEKSSENTTAMKAEVEGTVTLEANVSEPSTQAVTILDTAVSEMDAQESTSHTALEKEAETAESEVQESDTPVSKIAAEEPMTVEASVEDGDGPKEDKSSENKDKSAVETAEIVIAAGPAAVTSESADVDKTEAVGGEKALDNDEAEKSASSVADTEGDGLSSLSLTQVDKTAEQGQTVPAAGETITIDEGDKDGEKSSVPLSGNVEGETQSGVEQKTPGEDGDAELSSETGAGSSGVTVTQAAKSTEESSALGDSESTKKQDENTAGVSASGDAVAADTVGKDEATGAESAMKSSNLEDVSDDEEDDGNDDDVVIVREDTWKKVVANIDLTVDDNTETPGMIAEDSRTSDQDKNSNHKNNEQESNVLVIKDGQLEVNMEVISVDDDELQPETILMASKKPWSSSGVTHALPYWKRSLQDGGEEKKWSSTDGPGQTRTYSRQSYGESTAQSRRSGSSREKSPSRYPVPSREQTARRRTQLRKEPGSPNRPPAWNREDERYQYSRPTYHPGYDAYRYTQPPQPPQPPHPPQPPYTLQPPQRPYEGDSWNRRYDKWNPEPVRAMPERQIYREPVKAERPGPRDGPMGPGYEMSSHHHSIDQRPVQSGSTSSSWRKDYPSGRERETSRDQPYGGYRKSAHVKMLRSRSRSLSSLSSEGSPVVKRKNLSTEKRKQPTRRVSHSPISVSSRSQSLSPVSKSPTPDMGRRRKTSASKPSYYSSRKSRERSASKSPHRYSHTLKPSSQRMRSRSPRQKSPTTPPRRAFTRHTGPSSRSQERRMSEAIHYQRNRSKSPRERGSRYKRSASPVHWEETSHRRKIFQSRSPTRHSRSSPSSWSPKQERTRGWVNSLEDAGGKSSRKAPRSREGSQGKTSGSRHKWDTGKTTSNTRDSSSSYQTVSQFSQPPPNISVPPPGYFPPAGGGVPASYPQQGAPYMAGPMPMYHQYGHQQYPYSTAPPSGMPGQYMTSMTPTHSYAQPYQGAYPVIQVPIQQVTSQQKQSSSHPPMQPPPKPPIESRTASPPSLQPSASSSNSKRNSSSGSQSKKNWSMGSNALVFQRILSLDRKGKNS